MAKEGKKIVVRFTQQQVELINKIKEKNVFGQTEEEIVKNVFNEFAKNKKAK